MKPSEPSLHAAILFATAIAVVNGFGRFAYALLLPPMRADLQWDYALSGWLNTANSIGYGIGALLGMVLLAKVRPAVLFVAGLVGTVATLFICAFTHDLLAMMVWRFLSGVGSAWVFACGGALIATKYGGQPARAAAAIAIYYAGGGLGIALSGLLLWPVLGGAWTWSIGWLMLGVAGALFAILPARIALGIGGAANNAAHAAQAVKTKVSVAAFKPLMVAYFVFGVGYIVYLTFVVAWMREMKLSVAGSVGVWVLLGVAVMASGQVWRGAMARWQSAHTFAAATFVTGLGTALPLLSNHPVALLASAVLVGGAFFMAPGAVMAFIRANLPAGQWAKAMNLMTCIFAIGQGIGPVVAGEIADRWNMNAAMLFGAVALALAALIALAQKPVMQTGS
jgi:predicted MFS family arabinose efflux permease